MITPISCAYKFFGLSTDDKDKIKNVTNGSEFVEIDTGVTYMYDAENKEWIKQE